MNTIPFLPTSTCLAIFQLQNYHHKYALYKILGGTKLKENERRNKTQDCASHLFGILYSSNIKHVFPVSIPQVCGFLPYLK